MVASFSCGDPNGNAMSGFWLFSTDIAAQANVGVQGNSGSRHRIAQTAQLPPIHCSWPLAKTYGFVFD